MPLTKTVLHNGTIIAGGNSGGIATGLVAGAVEVCYLIECTALAGVSSTLEIKNALNSVFHRAVYGIAGSLQNHSGYYILSAPNHDSFVAENVGAEDMSVKITLLSTDVLTLIPIPQRSIINKMFTKEEIIRLVELNTGKCVKSSEPHAFLFNQTLPNNSIKPNYIYYGQIDLCTQTTSLVGWNRIQLNLTAVSPNFAGATHDIYVRASYDGIATNQIQRGNLMFNNFLLTSGSFSGSFIGWRFQVD